MKSLRLFAALLILAAPFAQEGFAENLDFRPYRHGKVRRDSFTFFCLLETGGRHIVKLINSYLAGKITNKQAGDEIRKKVIVYQCNRQKLIHMSLETLIQGSIPDVETMNGIPVPITKDSSLVKAQAMDGLIVYVITNALVPPPGAERKDPKPRIGEKSPEWEGDRKKPIQKSTGAAPAAKKEKPKKKTEPAAKPAGPPGDEAKDAEKKTEPAAKPAGPPGDEAEEAEKKTEPAAEPAESPEDEASNTD